MSRYSDATGTQAEFLVVEMAKRSLGGDWMEAFVSSVKTDGLERVLV
jgi:hypothetical protein